jgi:ribosome-binding factor A
MVSEEIKRVVSDIIKNDVRDPRLPEILSIVHVDVSSDFSYAKIYYSVLNGQGNEKDIQNALKSASGFIRRELGSRVRLRQTPELRFELDTTIERVFDLYKLIDETMQNDAKKGK